MSFTKFSINCTSFFFITFSAKHYLLVYPRFYCNTFEGEKETESLNKIAIYPIKNLSQIQRWSITKKSFWKYSLESYAFFQIAIKNVGRCNIIKLMLIIEKLKKNIITLIPQNSNHPNRPQWICKGHSENPFLAPFGAHVLHF